MKAKILLLEGKYYGTRIEITDDSNFTYEIKLWNSESGIPSEREFKKAGMTQKQWENNEIIEEKHPLYSGRDPVELVGYETFKFPAKEILEITDNHFESRGTYEAALEIVRRINNFESLTKENLKLRENQQVKIAKISDDYPGDGN